MLYLTFVADRFLLYYSDRVVVNFLPVDWFSIGFVPVPGDGFEVQFNALRNESQTPHSHKIKNAEEVEQIWMQESESGLKNVKLNFRNCDEWVGDPFPVGFSFVTTVLVTEWTKRTA